MELLKFNTSNLTMFEGIQKNKSNKSNSNSNRDINELSRPNYVSGENTIDDREPRFDTEMSTKGIAKVIISRIIDRRREEEGERRRKRVDDAKEVSENKEILNVAFPIFGDPVSFINDKGEKDGIVWEMWKEIWDRLKSTNPFYQAMTVKYTIIEKPIVDDLFRDMVNKKYDIMLGDFTPSPERLVYSLFTEPLYSEKMVGVYSNVDDTGVSLDYNIWSKILQVLQYPLLGLFGFSVLMALQGYYYRRNKSDTFLDVWAQALNGIFNDGGGKLNGNVYQIVTRKNYLQWFFVIIMIIVSFIILFYLQTIAISKSLDILERNNDPFAFPEGKKILVPKGFGGSEGLKNCCKIIAVESKSGDNTTEGLAKEYEKRKKKEDLIGFYQISTLVNNFLKQNSNYSQSPTTFSEPNQTSFVVSKVKPEYLVLINESIHYLKWNGKLNKICSSFLNRFCTQPMNISMFFK